MRTGGGSQEGCGQGEGQGPVEALVGCSPKAVLKWTCGFLFSSLTHSLTHFLRLPGLMVCAELNSSILKASALGAALIMAWSASLLVVNLLDCPRSTSINCTLAVLYVCLFLFFWEKKVLVVNPRYKKNRPLELHNFLFMKPSNGSEEHWSKALCLNLGVTLALLTL